MRSVERRRTDAVAFRDASPEEPPELRRWDGTTWPDPREDPEWEPGGPFPARFTDQPQALRAAADLREPADAHDWFVVDLLRRGQIMILASLEGLGKSVVRRELSIRCATATGSLFGHYAIPAPLTVALFDEENGEAEEWRQEEMTLAALSLERPALQRYYRASHAGLALSDRLSQARLEREVAAVRPDVLILDTGTSMVGDEWGKELKAAVRFLRSLAVRYGCAIVVVVHLTKPARDGNGSDHRSLSDVMGQWSRQADVVAVMSDLGEGRARWETFKKCPKAVLILAQRSGLWDVVSIGTAARTHSADDRVLACLDAGAGTVPEIVAATGIAERTVWDAVRRLRRADILTARGPLRRSDGESAE